MSQIPYSLPLPYFLKKNVSELVNKFVCSDYIQEGWSNLIKYLTNKFKACHSVIGSNQLKNHLFEATKQV